ncbi:hypothetical protein KP509_1Z051800 [Ceratopteris richardii]|nr:hypothetical protein KP509_1Z051800 [Ceratopteris richardii]
MGPLKCKVCEDANSKYKCPTCLLPYCSLPCYKKHKETPCIKSEVAAESNAASEELRHMLKNPELQQLIKKIDSSDDVEKDLNAAMEDQLFRDFRDKVLGIVNPVKN